MIYNIIKMESVIDFWFHHSEIWFGCSREEDLLITHLFSNQMKEEYEKGEEEIEDRDEILKKILLFDQIMRHYIRVYEDISDEDKKGYDKLAKYYSEIVFEKNKWDEYKPEERCFICMPLRHTFIESEVYRVLECIQRWYREQPEIPIYKRFYKTTLESYSKIKTKRICESESFEYRYEREDKDKINDVLDNHSSKINEEGIDFIEREDIYETDIYKTFEKSFEENIHEKTVIISISGGVDSMVLSYFLYLYQKRNPDKVHQMIGISIHYDNRIEQEQEINMVNMWLQLLGILHYVRKIDEIKRSRDNERDIYEEITRNIRFDMYEKIGMKYEKGDGYGICLGHNKDDSLENVFSNIKKRRSYRNLYGMLERSEEDHIIILRPLLKIWKRDIIEIAHKVGIPYVYDSTPDWSERGKMRDILIPNMIHFDNEIVEGIFDMVNNFCEIYRIYERMIPEIIEIDENRIEVEDRGIYFYEYMKKIIYQICKKMKIKPIKNKSIFHISAELKRGNIHRITLSKECIVYKKEGWIVFIKK